MAAPLLLPDKDTAVTEEQEKQNPNQDPSQDPSQDLEPNSVQDPNQDLEPNSVQDQTQNQHSGHDHMGHMALADELGIEDLYDPMVGKDGKVFCTAGRDAPIAEFTDDFLILHPPQLPLDASDFGEEFSNRMDARGILLDELGTPKKISAATYKGCPIYYFGEQEPDTLKYYAVALAHDGSLHALFFENGRRLNTKDVYDLRNKSAQGELSGFAEITCDISDIT